MKKILFGLLAAGLISGIAMGCGSSNDTSEDSGSGDSDSDGDTDGDADADADTDADTDTDSDSDADTGGGAIGDACTVNVTQSQYTVTGECQDAMDSDSDYWDVCPYGYKANGQNPNGTCAVGLVCCVDNGQCEAMNASAPQSFTCAASCPTGTTKAYPIGCPDHQYCCYVDNTIDTESDEVDGGGDTETSH